MGMVILEIKQRIPCEQELSCQARPRIKTFDVLDFEHVHRGSRRSDFGISAARILSCTT
jgi:hypothetical protein